MALIRPRAGDHLGEGLNSQCRGRRFESRPCYQPKPRAPKGVLGLSSCTFLLFPAIASRYPPRFGAWGNTPTEERAARPGRVNSRQRHVLAARLMIRYDGTMTKSGLAASYGGTETILVVEDEPPVCRGIRRLLEWAGYQVLTASTASEAVEVAADPLVPIHLLLTDFALPGISGRELAGVLQRSRPGLRVLFMSGYSEEELPPVSDGSDAPFLQKPFVAETLLLQVRAVLHPRRRRTDAAG